MSGTAAAPEASGARPDKKRDPIGRVGKGVLDYVISPIWKRIKGVVGGLWNATGEQLSNEGTNLKAGLGIPEAKKQESAEEGIIQSVRKKVTKAMGWIGGIPGRAVGYTAGLTLAPFQYGIRGLKAVGRGLWTGETKSGGKAKGGGAEEGHGEPTPHPA